MHPVEWHLRWPSIGLLSRRSMRTGATASCRGTQSLYQFGRVELECLKAAEGEGADYRHTLCLTTLRFGIVSMP